MPAAAEESYDLVVVGAGPAGLAAACAAWEKGIQSILLVEREKELGGILNQCIHNGFGLHRFKEELTGPEYAARYITMLRETGVAVALDTMVTELTPDRKVHLLSKSEGYRIVNAGAVVLAMGCRERTRGAVGIPGTRPAGIFSAGDAQRYVNIDGYMVGRRVLVLGSGDIGLIMARRLTLEGAEVLACVELLPYPGGLNRNIVQCLHDFDIPLYLSHTVTDIRGDRRVEEAVVSEVDAQKRAIPGTEKVFACDTILLSVGLIPENELSRQAGVEIDLRTKGPLVSEDMQTSIPGVFACGNVLHVHDLVDFVSAESAKAGEAAARYLLAHFNQLFRKARRFGMRWDKPKYAMDAHSSPQNAMREEKENHDAALTLRCGEGVAYSVPQTIRPDRVERSVEIFFRVDRIYADSVVRVALDSIPIASFKRDSLAPGEMEHIVLSKELFAPDAKQLTLWIED